MTVHRTTRILFALALALVLSTGVRARQSSGGPYFVVFKSGALPADAAARVASAGGQVHGELPEIGTLSVSGDDSVIAALSGDPDVLAVGPQRLHGAPDPQLQELTDADAAVVQGAPLPADSLYFFQWNMRRIGAPDVWARLPLPTGDRRATVAVLDTGVADNHPDLVGQILVSKATTFCNTPGGPGNTAGYPKYSTLIDFDAHPIWTPADGCTPAMTIFAGHGTHVAGIVGARFGGGRVVGVAPDARIAVYKVFDRFRFTDPDDGLIDALGAFDGPLFTAIIDAVNSGYPVINMSLGGLILRSNQSHNAVWHAWDRVVKFANQRGTVIVAAAGNEEFNLNGPVAAIPSDLSTVISTSATGLSRLVLSGGLFVPGPGARDVLAFYSNHGAAVDIAAPGGDCGPGFPVTCEGQYFIISSFINSITGVATGPNAYAFSIGTSMAAPHAAAVAAMVRQLHPDWTPGHVRAHLKATAEEIGSRQSFGGGLINASLAVQ